MSDIDYPDFWGLVVFVGIIGSGLGMRAVLVVKARAECGGVELCVG